MNLKKGKWEYELPRNFLDIRQAFILSPKALNIALSYVPSKELLRMREKYRNEYGSDLLGLPYLISAAFGEDKPLLQLFPTPDKDYIMHLHIAKLQVL